MKVILLFSLFLLQNYRVLSKGVMPWMCLERCDNTTSAQVQGHLKQVKDHLDVISAVSFEMYNLGPNGTLVWNSALSLVGPTLVSFGIETYPMISSFPYPPQFLDWMRQVFQDPQPFIQQAIKEVLHYNFTGLNVDWEPTKTATTQDTEDYAKFLSLFADELHKINKKLTVDIANWNPLWNWQLLNSTSVDKLCLMATYTGNFNSFETQLQNALQAISLSKLGVGLMTNNTSNDGKPFTTQELQQRFEVISKSQVQEVDIWKIPLPDNWWPILQKFVRDS